MRRILTLSLLFSLMLTCACTMYREHEARNFSEATGGEGLERRFWQEVQAGNWVEIERVLASNYIGVTHAGSFDRAATLEQYRQLKLTNYSIGGLKTELNSNTFVVSYDITLAGTNGNQPLPSTPQHMMTVWQEQKKGWVIIAQSVTQP